MTLITLLMPLLGEGTDVWRPVAAASRDDGTYEITGVMPDSEEWAFVPGTVVAALPQMFGNGEEKLVAAATA